jgi:hypothetical protein
VARFAQRFGREAEAAALLIALSRAVGLWDEGAASHVTSPGCLTIADLGRLLFQTWRRGGAWDEARPDGECLRVPLEQRDPSPARVLRDMLLDGLRDIGQDTWAPYEALQSYVLDDPRTGGLERLLARWAARAAVPPPAPADLLRRLLTRSLPALGVVDLGVDDAQDVDSELSDRPLAVRLTARGKALLSAQATDRPPAPAEFVEARLLRVGDEVRIADVLELAPICELAAVEPYLELSLSAAGIARGLAAGLAPDTMRQRIARVATPTQEIDRALEQADTVIGQASLVAASGFLWVDDEELRHLLRTGSPCAELFVEQSPTGGLLVAPGVEPDRLIRRCRAMGVEVEVEEAVYRARRSTKPPPRTTQTTRRPVSWRPPAALVGAGPRRGSGSR